MAVMDREKWLEERRKGIGGSDAAALVGMNSYSTPYMVWADKTGRLPEKRTAKLCAKAGIWNSMSRKGLRRQLERK